MNKSFDVFLSHNSKDKPAVRELAESLFARGLKVWLDEWELVPGQPWQEALEEIIETTGASAMLVGKDGLGPWQDKEMRGCLSEFVERNLPVIPVLLPGAPEMPKLPLFLKRFTWVDLRGGFTEEGVDRLQWAITGSRPDRSKFPLIPTAASEVAEPHERFSGCEEFRHAPEAPLPPPPARETTPLPKPQRMVLKPGTPPARGSRLGVVVIGTVLIALTVVARIATRERFLPSLTGSLAEGS
ncbi:MAG TPA: toll/interleukin-1 receptor domain-containing protein, partial [Thermoanaerobaculia bacterium]|nr:toll/interleukin-1 receptor domain-containing protein [Thermoanaerobaculia bacterium]